MARAGSSSRRAQPGEGLARDVAVLQGVYWLAGGVWPVLSMATFEALTGRKTDRWLVKTVGLMMAAIGACLLRSAHGGGPSYDLRCAAASTALVVGAADTFYATAGRISKTYLLDAMAEAALVMAWCSVARREVRQ